MNTNYIKKKAIAGLLGELFEWTCHNNPEETAYRSGLMEPEDLQMFRMYLSILAELHYRNAMTIKDITAIAEYVKTIARKHGHLWNCDQYSSGSWGVRLSEVNKIEDIFDIPNDKVLLDYGDEFFLGVERHTIIDYKIYNTFLSVKLKQVDNESHREFEIPIEWRELKKLYKEKQ